MPAVHGPRAISSRQNLRGGIHASICHLNEAVFIVQWMIMMSTVGVVIDLLTGILVLSMYPRDLDQDLLPRFRLGIGSVACGMILSFFSLIGFAYLWYFHLPMAADEEKDDSLLPVLKAYFKPAILTWEEADVLSGGKLKALWNIKSMQEVDDFEDGDGIIDPEPNDVMGLVYDFTEPTG